MPPKVYKFIGQYSIGNTRKNIRTLGEQQLKGAMQLKYLVMEKYPKLAGRVHFDALLYDPMKVLGADTVILTGHSHDEGKQ